MVAATREHRRRTPTKKNVKVGLAYDIGGRGDKSFNDAAAAGLEQAKTELNIEAKELPASATETENDKYARLKLLCQGGYNPVIAVGFVYAGVDPANGPLAKAAKDCPDTKFAIIDDGSAPAPNVANLVFAEEQGSYLVGAAAALKSHDQPHRLHRWLQGRPDRQVRGGLHRGRQGRQAGHHG